MTTLSQLLRSLGILVFLFACASKPPSLQDALDLYREGHINEARREMVAYIKAKPFNPESEDARQHILLIRRIKQLESIAIAQWERSNIEGAKKIVGIIRILIQYTSIRQRYTNSLISVNHRDGQAVRRLNRWPSNLGKLIPLLRS
ncbi:hypothetical protein ACFL5M_06925 [Candidatus Neomarinimicrobiota bacterium]